MFFPPLKSQRILIGLGLIALAWFLHLSLCDWEYKQSYTATIGERPSYVPLVAVSHRVPDLSPTGFRRAYSGIFSELHHDPSLCVVFGIAVPLVLLALDAYLLMGWRYQARVLRGQCPACGYDLRGEQSQPADRCPECGWRRQVTGSTGA